MLFPWMQVRKYSKISAHDEIARGIISLPAWEQQGSQCWDQRVALQPARVGKGSAWGGEVLLRLQYTTVQVCLDNSTTLPSRMHAFNACLRVVCATIVADIFSF